MLFKCDNCGWHGNATCILNGYPVCQKCSERVRYLGSSTRWRIWVYRLYRRLEHKHNQGYHKIKYSE